MKERCLFYIDGGRESEAARKILDDYKVLYESIDLRLFASTDVTAPRLVTKLGRFEGLERIREYAEAFGSRVVERS